MYPIETALHIVEITPDLPEWVQLFPAGEVRGRDGRGPYRLDNPAAVVAATAGIGMDLPIDLDHQADLAPKGTPTPAAGWIKEVQARGDGLWGRVEWTAAASAAIQAKEYRYLSPVFEHDRKTGVVRRLLRASLTNYPNLPLKAVASQGQKHMDEFLKKLLAQLGLPEDGDESAIETAVAALADKAEAGDALVVSLVKSLDLAEDAKPEDIVAALAAREDKGTERNDDPDPAKYVSVESLNDVVKELATLKREISGEKATAAVDAAIKDGKLIPAQRDWAVAFASKDADGFAKFVETQPVLVAAGGAPAGAPEKGKGGLSETELAVCRAMGQDPEGFKKARDEEEAA